MRGSRKSANSKVIIYGDNYRSYQVALCDNNGSFTIPYKSDARAEFRIKLIDNKGAFEFPHILTP